MESSNQNNPNAPGHNIPKDSATQSGYTSPPPYTPPRRSSLATLSALAGRHIAQGESQILTRPLVTTSSIVDEQDEDLDGMSPLSLRINTSINISKSNNLVCLTESPASHANSIAEAVVHAIQRNSSGNCGIPMIDGDGNPRPIRIEVDAGLVVDGTGNIVGNEKVIDEVLRQRAESRLAGLRRPREETESEQSSKRRCSE